MAKKLALTLLFLIILSPVVYSSFENETSVMTKNAGDMAVYANEAIDGTLKFNDIFEYIKDLFVREFKNISKNLPILFAMAVLFSLKSCFKLEKGIESLVDFSCMCCIILLTAKMYQDITQVAKSLCEALGTFIFTSIPTLCAVVAASGLPVSASKGAFIILGASNILSFLINKVFFPVLYISYILSVSSAMVENDIFEAFKKTVISIIKTSLPFIVGIFTAVLTMFMKSSSKIDDFALKSAKMTIGNLVPFLGSVLSDSATAVLSSVGQIKSQIGILGIFGILSVLLFPLVKIISTLLTFKLMAIVTCFLTDKKSEKFYSELSENVSVMAGMAGTMAIMVLIGILVLMG